MAEENPLEDLYDQVEELLRFAQGKVSQPVDPSKVPPEAGGRLKKVQEDIAQFRALTRRILLLSGMSEEQAQEQLEGTREALPDNTKDLLKRGDRLLEQAKDLKQELEGTPPPIVEAKTKTPEKLTPRKRKGKFKRFGSDKNWKPL